MKQVMEILVGMVVIFIALFFGGLILAFPIKFLWNWLMPSILNLPTIGYWQAFGLFYLCGLLFKNISSNK
jgi:hypothetical protein